MSTEDMTPTFWYCQDHHGVETFAGCGGHNRIGPFANTQDAANALQTIADRERRYDTEDAAWDG